MRQGHLSRRTLLAAAATAPPARAKPMIDTATGAKRIRSGLPADWRADNKTGTYLDGKHGEFNDVAIAWPPGKAPLIIAAYFNAETISGEIRDEDQAVLAEVGRIATAWIS